MKIPRSFSITAITAITVSLFASTMRADAVDAYSPVVGFMRFDCPANSDTRVSVPFHRAPRWAGKLSAAPSTQGNTMRLTLAGSPAFAVDELTSTPHFLLCRDAAGPEGRHFRIVTHAAGHVDIEATPGDVSGLVQDGLISIIPAWTIQTLFPHATQTTFHASTGTLATGRRSELHLFDTTTSGTDLAPARRFFVTASGWREIGGSYPLAGTVAIAPGQSFIIRHPAGALPTTFVAMEQVYGGIVRMPVRVANGEKQDTVVAPPRPVAQSLAELDFGAVFEESPDLTSANRRDELHVYDNEATGQNKIPSGIYFRHAGAWVRDQDPSFPNSNSVVIDPAGDSLLIRKAAAATNTPLLWSNAPLYDVTAP
jgi:uncharacterized protein (TIGR02597 family)